MVALLLLGLLYVAIAPDPVTLAATRGAVGAARGTRAHRAATRPARRTARTSTGRGASGRSSGSTGRGAGATPSTTSTGPTAPVVEASRWDGVRAAWSGARSATSTARARRAAGVDAASRARRAAAVVAVAGAGAAVAGARHAKRATTAGMAAARTRLNGRTPTVSTGPTSSGPSMAGAAVVAGEVVDPADSTPAGSTTSPVMDDVDGAAVDGQDPSSPFGAGAEHVREGVRLMGMQTTELDSLAAVRTEAAEALSMIEALSEAVSEIKGWAAALPDRWAGTDWSTGALDSAVDSVGDAAAVLVDGEDLEAALRAVEEAVSAAEVLGEAADSVGATGSVDAFRAA